ncbi:acylphosphatase-2 [Scaptodrosophila lebanonensis]|uniref:Acylphosphatase n=1 Tax=Drosophila lebanonensis TaxID=7225 RepID=A0A6J2U5B5_DROLE|nr:acylphosphatase-2 [Scaptodrosophila lebanonensis]
MANKIKDSKLELQRETTSLASSLSKKPISDKQKTIWSVNFEISGKVQGVFFRKHTLTQARKLGLHGWCMNTTHGTVKGVLEGPLEQITDMRYWLQHKGSPRSIIQKADFTPNQPIPNYCYKTFSIRK